MEEAPNYLVVRTMFALLGAVVLWRSGSSAYSYFDMRSAEVLVKTSRLSIDHNPSPNEPPYEYAIDVELETTDSSHRRINERLELPEAGCPEEAYDELAHWAPGSIHQIYLLRGDATDIRLEPGRGTNQELTEAAMWLFPGVFALLGWMAFQDADGKLGAHAFSLVFFVFGIPLLLSGLGIIGQCVWKRFGWQQSEVKVIEATRRWDPALAPAGTKIHPVAAQKLTEMGPYRLAEFSFNGRKLRLGLSAEASGSTYQFWVNPSNRFDYTWDPWYRATGPDVFVFLLMGLVFSGIGYGIYLAGSSSEAEPAEEARQPQQS